MANDKNLKISGQLFEKMQQQAERYGFSCVEEYLLFIVKNLSLDAQDGVTQEEENEIKQRLKSLGYIN